MNNNIYEKFFGYLKEKFEKKKNYIAYTQFNLLLEDYIKMTLYYSLFFFIFGIVAMSILFIIIFKFYNIVLMLFSMLFGFMLSLIIFIYFYYYPDLAKEDYRKDLEDNLPYFAQYLYSLSGSGMNIIDVFRLISKRNDFGSLSKEIKYLVTLIDVFGMDFISAIITIANKTPSYKFKQFLFGLLSVIRSGGDLKEYIKTFSNEQIEDYEIELKTYSEKANIFITLYSFIFITFPMVLLIIAFLFSYIDNSTSILTSLEFFFLVILSLSYIAYLYFIHISQPKL